MSTTVRNMLIKYSANYSQAWLDILLMYGLKILKTFTIELKRSFLIDFS